jgi:hypothetical protein
MEKRILIWAVAHLLVATWVVDELRKQGKSEQEAQLGGHMAGAAAGFVLSSVL